jgi:ABC-type transport system involved in multi-copper enzyme maturation permease subunit
MLDQIRLEFRKHKFRGSWLGVLIANLAIMGLFALMYFEPGMEEDSAMMSYADAFSFIETLVRSTFIIYASVLLAKFVIEEYKNKTISLMFTYPINRKKLMASKLIIVFVWTLLAIILSNAVVGGALLAVNHFVGKIPGTLEWGELAKIISNDTQPVHGSAQWGIHSDRLSRVQDHGQIKEYPNF